jgi:hypothetical protein
MILQNQQARAVVRWTMQCAILCGGIVLAGGLAQAGFVSMVDGLGLAPAVIASTLLAFVVGIAMTYVSCLIGATAESLYDLGLRLLSAPRAVRVQRALNHREA